MLTPRKTIRATLLVVSAVLLIAGTAAGKNERAAQRREAKQQRAARTEQRQAKAAQRQSQNQARRQAAAEQRAERQAATAQRRADNQTQRQANRAASVEQRAEKQAQRQENRQVRVERREVGQEQTAQKRQAAAEQRTEKQAQRQENRQARIVQRQERNDQAAQRRTEKSESRNDSKSNVTKSVNRDVNIQRIFGPSGTKTITERDFQRTVTRNGRTFTKNFSKTVVRDRTKRFDRPRVIRPHNDARHSYSFVSRRTPGRRPGSVFRHIVWRGYGYPVYYRHGPDLFVHYVRPAYHRKYVFVGIGSCWPTYYSSLRYYWYGLHPYHWYGSYPTAYNAGGDTYNYYTYNTYNYETAEAGGYTTSEPSGPLEGVDETTFEDVRQKLEQQSQQQPETKTLADKFFEDGVTAFEQEDYNASAAAFADAIALEPNDLILPFAYVQALFAGESYSKAADILRPALVQMPAEEQGLFFPRGLYSDDEILFEQIDRLQKRAETFAYEADMPLLLGYQLIGVERYDEARQWLERAGQYDLNTDATAILLDLLDKLEEQSESTSENI